MLTETWLIEGLVCQEELKHEHSIEILTMNRKEKNGQNTEAGVVIAYKHLKYSR